MSYFPSVDGEDARAMLAELGVDNVDQLFSGIPVEIRRTAGIDLAAAEDEADLVRRMRALAARNRAPAQTVSFVGAGAYAYPVLAAAQYAVSRGEFLTAYTPYQPEIAQGTLQALFEFQTWVSELSGLPVANASMYDGATALAEAALMALRVRRKVRTVWISAGLAPRIRAVVRRYLAGQTGLDLYELPLAADGRTDLTSLAGGGPAVVLIGSPNGYGVIEDLRAARAAVGRDGFLISHTPDPHAWLILEPPGSAGVDVAVAEGQPLGIPPSFGGPHLGLLATREEFIRQIPGRLCGQTVDRDGRRAFVLTLSTREQHIRREKATSNICTNQGIMALMATVTMGTLGPEGLRARALRAAHSARALESLLAAAGFRRRFGAPYFNEFVVDHPDAPGIWKRAMSVGVQIGMPLDRWQPGDTGLLVAATAAQREPDLEMVRKCLLEK